MTNLELKIARQMLGFSVAEAAEHIGGVTPQMWRYFERGERAIRDVVIDKMQGLLSLRRELLTAAKRKQEESGMEWGDYPVTVYPDDGGDFNEWKVRQSVAAVLVFDYGARLVTKKLTPI